MSETLVPSEPRAAQRRGPLKAALAWLLRLDMPIPQRTEDELLAEVERNYNWNFTVNLMDGAFFWFGSAFISAATILSVFLSKLTTNPIAFGLLAVIAQASWYIPQLFTANTTERVPSKKAIAVNLGFFLERLPILLLPGVALIAGASPMLAAVLFLLVYAWHGLGAGVLAVSWQDLIARTFPVTRRGRLLGLTAFLGAGMGVLGALASARLLATYAFPINFFWTFLIAGVFILISWGWLALTREPIRPVTAPRRSEREYLARLPELVRHDQNFRRFLTARMVIALAGMGVGFITVSAVSRWNIPDATAGYYTLAFLIGQTLGNLMLGFLADRKGHKLSLEIGTLAGFAAFLTVALAPSPAWYYLAFALNGIVVATLFVSGILIVMELAEPARRPTYAGIANTAVGAVSIVAPLLGAVLAEGNYTILFAGSAVVYLVGFVLLHWGVAEPRHALTQES
jgi:MFS family permease